ncbi:MAG: TolC family protein [Bryobacteraceae bacterium]
MNAPRATPHGGAAPQKRGCRRVSTPAQSSLGSTRLAPSVPRFYRRSLAVGLSWLCAFSLLPAQEAPIAPVRPSAPIVWRPYLSTEVPPARLANSPRLRDLVRAGKLYLTAQDAIALALENNIDVEVARYNPLVAAWQLERAQAGGALPGVPSSASQAGSVASGQGVSGSQAAAGVTAGPSTVSTTATGNATIAQIGPVTQTLDPTIQETSTFSHKSTPQSSTVQSGVANLIDNTRVYSGSLQEGFLSGGSVNVSYSNHYLNENSPTDVLNPSEAPSLSVTVQHNFLNGFGVAVNARTITVARINLRIADLNFRTQVIGVVVSVLNAYYALSADYENVRANQTALDVAQKFYEDNRKQVEVGTLAPLDLTTAESQVASSQRDLVVAETSLQQDEVTLKNLLSRNGIADPALASAQIVPVDRISMPTSDDLPPVGTLVRQALANRSDLAAERANITSAETSALGTRNGLLPVAGAYATLSEVGLAGTPQPVVVQTPSGARVETANPYFAGGLGSALGQMFRRDFPSDSAVAYIAASLRNRQAQADYGIDQLQLRQTQLTTEKDFKQAQVDVMNSVVALRQARARYDAAVHNRILAQQLLDAEQKKFALGASTPYAVVQQQRDLASAQSVEISSLVSYSNAHVALDRTLGTTLDVNHVNIGEVRDGRIAQAPAAPPAGNPGP